MTHRDEGSSLVTERGSRVAQRATAASTLPYLQRKTEA